jgi:membrane protein implicated in regulation of membrane protease activity
MKKTLINFFFFTVATLIIVTVFKFFHLPYANTIAGAGLIIVSVFLIYSGYYLLAGKEKSKN